MSHSDQPADATAYRSSWSVAVAIFALSLLVFGAFAGSRLRQQSTDPHFVYLADSYLHGTLEVRGAPPHGNDWATVETLHLKSGQELKGFWWNKGQRKFMDLRGRLYVLDVAEARTAKSTFANYVSFPPMPAVLMMPFVAVWGMAFNDVLFTVAMAALNVVLAWGLLLQLGRLGYTRLSRGDLGWLLALFGFGTAHLWCSVLGQVWFTALVVGVTFNLLYVRAVLARSFFWAGTALAFGFASRTPLLYATVFAAAALFFPNGQLASLRDRRFWRDGLLFAVTPLVVGLLLMAANQARFERLGEFGHTYLANGQLDRIKQWGLFNYHFLSRNLAAMFALLPKLQPEAPYLIVSKHGLAIWLTTPAYLYLLWPKAREGAQNRWLHRAAWATIAAIATSHLFYQNTGWEQFGYRFQMDYLPFLLVLLAQGRDRLSWLFKVAIIWGIAANAFGAVTFKRAGRFYDNWFFEE
jgi:hypothetical protein